MEGKNRMLEKDINRIKLDGHKHSKDKFQDEEAHNGAFKKMTRDSHHRKRLCIPSVTKTPDILLEKSPIRSLKDDGFAHPKKTRVEFDSEKQHNEKWRNDQHNSSGPEKGRQHVSNLRRKPSEDCATDNNDQSNACVICKLGGQLLFCAGKGCKNGYHPRCLDPPLNYIPPGIWHCIWCVMKKINFGVHSVSNGVDSIWEAKETVSGSTATRSEQKYRVKYQGLAHVHNNWVEEAELLLEAPKLVSRFNKKNQDTLRWKEEWTVPHRLLQKRKLSVPEPDNRDDASISNCKNEWLVKWTGLDYDQATWELECASFLKCPKGAKLMADFESRHEKAENLLPEADTQEKDNLEDLPLAYNRHRSYVNQLRKHWSEGQNALCVDEHGDQERVIKAIMFILSLQSSVSVPFLVISTPRALSVWEDEFLNLAPFANVVVYKGTKDVRSSIRSLEFFNERGCTMFQVLLSSSDAVIEDLEELVYIGWEAIIIDECQRSNMSRHFEKFKSLTANMMLLLLGSQIKDSITDYLGLLYLLESGSHEPNIDTMNVDSESEIDKAKKQLEPYIAFECKAGLSRFIEHWVPVPLSDLQLEQYCAILLSQPLFHCSWMKNDSTDVLRETISSIRKCCDHPYLFDRSLQAVVTNGVPIEMHLDAEIKASGKLRILDKILSEMKSQEFRVLILFQSSGASGWDSSFGNILDDFICQRFGKDSYVRIDGKGYIRSKKQELLNSFNDKKCGRFVLLMDTQVCIPSVKLNSVDTVILLNSNYDPLSDLKALNKITIGSRFQQIKVFRLYSPYTVEEEVLILAKEGATLDCNIQLLSWKTCDKLLKWGATHLFQKLDEFHGSNSSSGCSFFDDVLDELLIQLPSRVNNTCSNCSVLSKVSENGVYGKDILLHGERKDLTNSESPSNFWTHLLNKRDPVWKLLPAPSLTSRRKAQETVKKHINVSEPLSLTVRRKVQDTVEHTNVSEPDDNPAIKTNPEVTKRAVDPAYPKSRAKDKTKHVQVEPEENIPETSHDNSTQALCNLNQGTQSSLETKIVQLCETLELPENVKAISLSLMEYVTKEYDVSWKTEPLRQAFQISLCWAAASLSEHNINHKETLAKAKWLLNFNCELEADLMYSIVQDAMKEFTGCSGNVDVVKESNNTETAEHTSCEEQRFQHREIPVEEVGGAACSRGKENHDDSLGRKRKHSEICLERTDNAKATQETASEVQNSEKRRIPMSGVIAAPATKQKLDVREKAKFGNSSSTRKFPEICGEKMDRSKEIEDNASEQLNLKEKIPTSSPCVATSTEGPPGCSREQDTAPEQQILEEGEIQMDDTTTESLLGFRGDICCKGSDDVTKDTAHMQLCSEKRNVRRENIDATLYKEQAPNSRSEENENPGAARELQDFCGEIMGNAKETKDIASDQLDLEEGEIRVNDIVGVASREQAPGSDTGENLLRERQVICGKIMDYASAPYDTASEQLDLEEGEIRMSNIVGAASIEDASGPNRGEIRDKSSFLRESHGICGKIIENANAMDDTASEQLDLEEGEIPMSDIVEAASIKDAPDSNRGENPDNFICSRDRLCGEIMDDANANATNDTASEQLDLEEGEIRTSDIVGGSPREDAPGFNRAKNHDKSICSRDRPEISGTVSDNAKATIDPTSEQLNLEERETSRREKDVAASIERAPDSSVEENHDRSSHVRELPEIHGERLVEDLIPEQAPSLPNVISQSENQAITGNSDDVLSEISCYSLHELESLMREQDTMVPTSENHVGPESYWNSLENEMRRIYEENNKLTKIYEDKILEVDRECEEEIREVSEEICAKYDTVLQNSEAVFLQKKGDLDTRAKMVNHNKSLSKTWAGCWTDCNKTSVLSGYSSSSQTSMYLPTTSTLTSQQLANPLINFSANPPNAPIYNPTMSSSQLEQLIDSLRMPTMQTHVAPTIATAGSYPINLHASGVATGSYPINLSDNLPTNYYQHFVPRPRAIPPRLHFQNLRASSTPPGYNNIPTTSLLASQQQLPANYLPPQWPPGITTQSNIVGPPTFQPGYYSGNLHGQMPPNGQPGQGNDGGFHSGEGN